MPDLHPSTEHAIAAAQPAHIATVLSPEFRAFANGLKLLLNLDCDELLAAGVIDESIEFRRFEDDPFRFFIRASDRRAAALWDLLQARQPRRPASPAEPRPMSDPRALSHRKQMLRHLSETAR